MAIGELTDFGYILFYLPYKRGEKNIILSTGNWYLDGVQSVNNWSDDISIIAQSEHFIRDNDNSLEKLFYCIRSFGPDIEDEAVLYCILDNADDDEFATILCYIKNLQHLTLRDLTASEVKKLILYLRRIGAL